MTTYAFVDLGYFLREIESFAQFVFPNAKDDRPDMRTLKAMLGGASRMFIYYAAEQDSSGAGNAKQAERLAQQQKAIDWLGMVQRLNGVHVRWGDVKHKPRKKERIQKRVDVMLAVDMMKHAYRRTMDHAVVLTGDLDFQPLVEELVETGCHVTVAACRWSSAGPLLDAADGVIELDAFAFLQLLRDQESIHLFGRLSLSTPCEETAMLRATGSREDATLYKTGSINIFNVRFSDRTDRVWRGDDVELLKSIVLYEIDGTE